MKLTVADVCRDGGSIVADFELDGGAVLSLLLEVSAPGYPVYGHLHAGNEIQNRCNSETVVPKGSSREKDLLSMLESWQASISSTEVRRHLTGELRRSGQEGDQSLHWALELCRHITNRKG